MNGVNYLKVTDETMNALFLIPICSDMVDNLLIKGNKIFFSSMDKNIYLGDIQKDLTLYKNRLLMKEEDRQSLQYMAYLAKESKKKGKPKSKKSKPPTANTVRSKSVVSGKDIKSKPSSAMSNLSKPGTSMSKPSKPGTAQSRISESVKSPKSAVKSNKSSKIEKTTKEKKKIPKKK
jgi:hypothetical protein